MMINPPPSRSFQLPLEISEGSISLEQLKMEAPGGIDLVIPDDYEQRAASPELHAEVFAIQRLLSLARHEIPLTFVWSAAVSQRLVDLIRLQPLLAVAVMLQAVSHRMGGLDAAQSHEALRAAREAVLKHHLIRNDLFTPSQILLCADSRGQGRHEQLYLPKTGALRPREHFETLVEDVLSNELSTSVDSKKFKWATGLGGIVAELFENTDMHAMVDLQGSRFPTNALRGLMFRRIPWAVQLRGEKYKLQNVEKNALEISVFDTGIGYLQSFTQSTQVPDIEFEWRVLHKCLERHYAPDIADARPAHRALGLAHVLRSLQAAGGRIEIRTGRLFAYRTFIQGELQAQMLPPGHDLSRFSWPRPRMLDMNKKVVAVPTAHEQTIGSAVRVVVPLS